MSKPKKNTKSDWTLSSNQVDTIVKGLQLFLDTGHDFNDDEIKKAQDLIKFLDPKASFDLY